MKHITITIITVTYQAGELLRITANSILQQNYPHVQHIIIDGASTDNTLNIAYQYQQQSQRKHKQHTVTITSEPDNGIYHAMNKGLKQATGEYILFLNAGDTLTDADTLERIATTAQNQHTLPAVIYGDTDIVDPQGIILHPRRLAPPQQLNWKSFRHGMLVCHQAFYARTDIAKQTPYNLKYKYSADVDWCIRILKKAQQQQLNIINTHLTLTHFLQQGTTTQHHAASLKERFHVMRQHYGLTQTILLHVWFILRALLSKLHIPIANLR